MSARRSLLLALVLTTSALAGTDGLPAFPVPTALHNHTVEPIYGQPAYVDRLIEAIDAATETAFFDLYILGGADGVRVAEAMAAAKARGVDVRILFNRHMGTAGKTRKEVKMVTRRLEELGVYFAKSRVRKGKGTRRWISDHNKLSVIDSQVVIVGGTNISDVFARFNDLMVRVEGPVAAQVHQQFRHDWAIAHDKKLGKGLEDLVFEEEGLLQNQSEPGLSTIRLVGTGLGRRTFDGALVNALRSATESIEVQVHQLNHYGAIDAILDAHERGVAVRVLLDPGNIDFLVPLIKKGPRGIFNAYATKQFLDAGVPIRFAEIEDEGFLAHHMKFGLVDGKMLLLGTANWDRRAAQSMTETVLEIAGGDAVQQIRDEFDLNWTQHSTEASVGYFARTMNALMRWFF